MKIFLLGALALMLQTDVAYKSSDEFSLELNYAFKQRPASDISTFEFGGNQEERDKAKYGGGPLPYLIVQIKLLKLGDRKCACGALITRRCADYPQSGIE